MYRVRVRLVVLAGLLFVGGPLIGCGANPQPDIVPGPPIPGLNLNGKWYSDQFGDMQVVHDKNSVRGTYEDPRGPDHNGRFKGTVQGDLLKIEWVKPGNAVAAIIPVRGKAWLRVTQKGARMEGRWGYESSRDDGGIWTAEKSQFN